MNNKMIETGSNYYYLLKTQNNPSFESIRKLSVNFVNQLPEEVKSNLWEQLENGVQLLDNEALMSVYMYAYGKMHWAKLNFAFENLPEIEGDIHIIDWGCGQALATMAYATFLKQKNREAAIKSITLIEPSETCLKRAALHVETLLPDVETKCVCKFLDEISPSDIEQTDSNTVLHLFSNILDVVDFSLEMLAETIQTIQSPNYFVCVSPYINDYKNARLYNFIDLMGNAETLFEFRTKEWHCGWTIDCIVAKNNDVEVDKSYDNKKTIVFANGDVYEGDFEDGRLKEDENIKNTGRNGSLFQSIKEYLKNTVTDIDGNLYHTIKIGNQTWMVENLRTTHYNDGTLIPHITDKHYWNDLQTSAYCFYGNKPVNKGKFGLLYNWFDINSKKIAPKGWHVPTDDEWAELENYLIANGYNYDGSTEGSKIAKALAAKEGWRNSDKEGDIGNNSTNNNSSGFSAIAGGYRISKGTFFNVGNYGHWWSSTGYNKERAWCWRLSNIHCYTYRYHRNIQDGLSIRCVKDEEQDISDNNCISANKNDTKLLTENEYDYLTSNKRDNTLIEANENMIKEITTKHLLQTVEMISEIIAREVILNGKISGEQVRSIFNDYKLLFEELLEKTKLANNESKTKHVQAYLDNWNHLESMVLNALKNRTGFEISQHENFVPINIKLKIFLTLIENGEKHYITQSNLFCSIFYLEYALPIIFSNSRCVENEFSEYINYLKQEYNSYWFVNLANKLISNEMDKEILEEFKRVFIKG